MNTVTTDGRLDEGRATFQGRTTEAPVGPRSNIALSDEELRALCWALDNYLPGLRYDEARVKLERNRRELVDRERLLSSVRERLEVALGGGNDAITEP
jgi:hypothetical protein